MVYIKDFEMPASCCECPCCVPEQEELFGDFEFFCVFSPEPIQYYVKAGRRSDFCPLRSVEKEVVPHV